MFNSTLLKDIPRIFKRPEIRATLDYEEDFIFFKTIIDHFFSKTTFLAKNVPERIIFCVFLLFCSMLPGDVHFSKRQKSAISNISRAILLISRNSVHLKGHFIHKNTNFYTTLSSTYTKHKNMTIFKAHKDHFCFYFMHLTTTKIPR